MNSLQFFCPRPVAEARILNALWRELNPDAGKRPTEWEPLPRDVALLNLRIIPGFGEKSRMIVQAWLRALL